MEIIQRREVREAESFQRTFEFEDSPGAGFAFTCGADGAVKDVAPAAERNYLACLEGSVGGRAVVDRGVIRHTWSWVEPAIGRCECGEEVCLDRFTNTCDGCGRDYNSAGQGLAPREFWGEETGESLADILSVDRCGAEELLG